jgi:hypothetical protein
MWTMAQEPLVVVRPVQSVPVVQLDQVAPAGLVVLAAAAVAAVEEERNAVHASLL